MGELVTFRRCLAIDLADGDGTIGEYESWHRPGRTPAPVIAALRTSGIVELEIYRVGRRLFMVMETEFCPSDDEHAAVAAVEPDVNLWNALMASLQRPLAGAKGWTNAPRVFRLSDHPS